jgi:hypothetical protein
MMPNGENTLIRRPTIWRAAILLFSLGTASSAAPALDADAIGRAAGGAMRMGDTVLFEDEISPALELARGVRGDDDALSCRSARG